MKTLQEHLATGYDWSVRKSGEDPAGACAKEIDATALKAKAAELQKVMLRCHVSRTHHAMIQRALALKA